MSEKERARRSRHRRFMETYWCARQAWLEALEQATALYRSEMEDFMSRNPPPLFKQYLIETAGQPR